MVWTQFRKSRSFSNCYWKQKTTNCSFDSTYLRLLISNRQFMKSWALIPRRHCKFVWLHFEEEIWWRRVWRPWGASTFASLSSGNGSSTKPMSKNLHFMILSTFLILGNELIQFVQFLIDLPVKRHESIAQFNIFIIELQKSNFEFSKLIKY